MKKLMSTSLFTIAILLLLTNCSAQETKMHFPDRSWTLSKTRIEDGLTKEVEDELDRLVINEMNTTGLFVVQRGKLI
ncbi:MAG: hypothetical protein QNK33_07240, partial [Bacteroidales bacterium]|nr:hypothetical protein [Bacteroidales bacterium]